MEAHEHASEDAGGGDGAPSAESGSKSVVSSGERAAERQSSPVHAGHRALTLLGHPSLLPRLGQDNSAYFESVVRALVPALADGCTIDVVCAKGLKPLAVAHVDPAREVQLREIERRDLSRILQGAVLRVPLSALERQLGVFTVWSEQSRALEPSELALLHWIAGQLAILLENQRLQGLLEESVRSSDALLSMVSHELRTPLATIALGIDASAHRIEASADEIPKTWLLERLQKMRKAVRRTDRLIHTFLGVSQIQTGRLVHHPEDTDLAALACAVVDALQDDLSWAGCECIVHAARPQVAHCDPIQLEIVLNNLLTNAMKYAPGSRVEVAVDADAEHVLVRVRDHGPGIPAEQRPRLFQRFSRPNAPARTVGFGLGLWLVKHFVEANAGAVAVESEIGRGTTFSLRLPRASVPARQVT